VSNGSNSSDEVLAFLVLGSLAALALYVWFKIKAAAQFLGVDPEVLLEAGCFTVLFIGAAAFLWLKDVVEKTQALLATTAVLLWILPVRMLLNSKAALTQPLAGVLSYEGTPEDLVVYWYNDWPFIWGVGLVLVAWAIWAWRNR